jgi:serine/threonine-protein kinase HipA
MIQGFKIWRITPDKDIIPVGSLAIKPGSLTLIEFKYFERYVQDKALPLDPQNLPLSLEKYTFEVSGRDLPGFIDDSLPDKWGEKLIALSLGKRYINKIDVIKKAFNMATLGDVIITPLNGVPSINTSVSLYDVEKVLSGDALNFSDHEMIIKHLPLYLAGGGSPGGARPKLLIEDRGKQWLYKFNIQNDPFDMSVAEWASLEVAKKAGLQVPKHQIVTLNGSKCFRVERFDVSPEGGRYHLLTFNSLLKDSESRDPHIASYEDITKFIRMYSNNPVTDCHLLLGQIFINSELKNTDDHLRNFSLLNKGNGWELSPVYDIVPDPTIGEYHQIQLLSKDYLPTLEQAVEAGRALGIDAETSKQIANNVANALAQWDEILDGTDASDADLVALKKIVRPELRQKQEFDSKIFK